MRKRRCILYQYNCQESSSERSIFDVAGVKVVLQGRLSFRVDHVAPCFACIDGENVVVFAFTFSVEDDRIEK